MIRLRITAQARADIGAIGRYTRRFWGRRQAEDYVEALDRRMRWLAEDPLRGRPRDDIAPGYCSYPEGSHLVVYMMVGDELAVIGIPHQSMDLRAYFDGAPKK